MASTARGRRRRGRTVPERKACMPGRPSSPTVRLTRVRVAVPARARRRALLEAWAAASVGMGSIGTAAAAEASGRAATASATSCPPIRRRQSARTQRFQVRWASRATWASSPPPTPSGPASGQTDSTRSGEAWRISTASARQVREVISVRRARTVSPGRAWRTKMTRPPGSSTGRATQCPPCAGAPTARVSSRGSPRLGAGWSALRLGWGVIDSPGGRHRRRRCRRGCAGRGG